MELIYRGFDGLDVSFRGHIDPSFCRALELAKEEAQKFHRDEFLEWRGRGMLVGESGARGGYAFTARTESPQAVWFFKRPNGSDPWGVRVSCASFQLATQGFGKTRADLIEALDNWGIRVPHQGESISRIDYAMDFLAPALTLVPNNFVMHSNSRRSDHHSDLQMRTSGKSGRITSVTIGQMPGRQIIVYDKRAEAISKRKVGWFNIWDAARQSQGKTGLDYSNPSTSRVWRVETRAGKKHLKDTWGIRTWEDLDARVGDLFLKSLEAIRYAVPTPDSNRARWPNHALWLNAAELLREDLFEFRSFADPLLIKRVHRDAHDDLLASQMLGLLVSRAALNGIDFADLARFAQDHSSKLIEKINADPTRYEKQLARAKRRYVFNW